MVRTSGFQSDNRSSILLGGRDFILIVFNFKEVEMFKFKVGEIVKHKIVKGKFIIMTSHHRQYANGCEITYDCRSDEKGEYGYHESTYQEHELEKVD